MGLRALWRDLRRPVQVLESEEFARSDMKETAEYVGEFSVEGYFTFRDPRKKATRAAIWDARAVGADVAVVDDYSLSHPPGLGGVAHMRGKLYKLS